jgi:diacylglycerol kinase (ATP)
MAAGRPILPEESALFGAAAEKKQAITRIRRIFMEKVLVIVNPVSGRGNGNRSIPAIENSLRALAVPFELVRTERVWHAAELAKAAALRGFTAVVAAGGDGTANEVLNGLMESGSNSTAMGLLCVGRGNDFAFGMGVPRDLDSGCRVIADDFRRRIDVGRVTGGFFPQGRYFGNGVGIGFDAVVGFEALKLKRLKGFLSYAVAAVKTISLYDRPPLVRVVADGEERTERSLLVSLMNGRRMGGGFFMAPAADPGDGFLDYCIAGHIRRRKILPLMMRFLKGTQASHPAISMGRFKTLRATALDGALPAHADGETLCTDGTELSIEILPARMDMLVPKPA